MNGLLLVEKNCLTLFRTDELKWGDFIGEDKQGNKYYQNRHYPIGKIQHAHTYTCICTHTHMDIHKHGNKYYQNRYYPIGKICFVPPAHMHTSSTHTFLHTSQKMRTPTFVRKNLVSFHIHNSKTQPTYITNGAPLLLIQRFWSKRCAFLRGMALGLYAESAFSCSLQGAALSCRTPPPIPHPETPPHPDPPDLGPPLEHVMIWRGLYAESAFSCSLQGAADG